MLVLGVDGGGTKTLAVIADRAGALVAFATGPDTNPLNQTSWREHLERTVAAVFDGVDPERLAAAAFGLPVHGEIADVSAEQVSVARRLVAGATVRNDVHMAHEGAFAGGPGVLLLAGTGSMCWAADASGHIKRVGGWGDGFGDEGSAHWIGLGALSRTSWVLDGRLDGRLAGAAFADAILAAVGVTRAEASDGLLRWYYHAANRRPAVAALAETVDRLAGQGDAIAGELLDAAAEALAVHVTAARVQLDLPEPGPWCFVGGVSRSEGMSERLTRLLGSAPAAPLMPPVGGAAWRAAMQAGWAPDAAWIDRLRTDISQRLEIL